jgi:hypothetical protein
LVLVVSGVLLTARLVLAVVLALAAVGKLLDPRGARRAAREFGVPVRLAGPVAIVLPLVELAAAVALVGRGSARWGALGALALLALFSLVIARALANGRHPDCHCFGQLHSTPAGRGAFLRNLVLAGLAGFILAAGWSEPGASATGWLGRLSPDALAAIAVAVTVLAVQAGFSWQLLRQHGRLLRRIERLESQRSEGRPLGLPVGSKAPDFVLATLAGGSGSLAELTAAGHPLLLLFSDPRCGPCRSLMPELSFWGAEKQFLRLVLISGGGVEANEPSAELFDPELVLIDDDDAVRDAYDVHGTPAALVVDRDGRIGSPVSVGAKAIWSLVSWAGLDDEEPALVDDNQLGQQLTQPTHASGGTPFR